MANFPILSFEQSNPVLGGYSAVQQILKNNLLGEYQKLLNQQRKTENQYQPQELEEKIIEMRNRNKLSPLLLEKQQIFNQYEPQKQEAELNKLKQSAGNPLLGQPGVAGQIGAMLHLSQHPELAQLLGGAQKLPGANPSIGKGSNLAMSDEDIQKLATSNDSGINKLTGGRGQFDPIAVIQSAIESEGNRKNARSDLDSKRANALSFNSLPIDDKKQLLAQLRGMGINADEGSRRLAKGESLDSISTSEGYDSKNLPDLIYPATSNDISKAHFREQAMTELDQLGKKITESTAPYSQRIAGYSPKQVAEALSGENPDSQAKFLAASALQPEMAALRLKVAGGNIGIEAIREVTNASMGHINKFQSLVKPDVYKKANKYLDEWITDAAKKSNKVWLNQRKSSKNQDQEQDNDPLGIR